MTTMTQRVAGAWAAQAATTNARTTYAQWADTEPLWGTVDLQHLPIAMLRMPYVQACTLFRFLLVQHQAGDQFATLTAVHLLRAGLTTQLSVFGRVMYRLEAGAVDSAVYLAAVEAIDSAATRDRETLTIWALLNDIRHRVRREVAREFTRAEREVVSDAEWLDRPAPEPEPEQALEQVLAAAVASAVIETADAQLLLQRCDSWRDPQEFSAHTGLTQANCRQRHSRATRKLRAAAAAGLLVAA